MGFLVGKSIRGAKAHHHSLDCHLQLNKHRYLLKENTDEAPEGWGGEHMGFAERLDAIELNSFRVGKSNESAKRVL